jgi:flagellar basal body P-ring protein FlgI
LALFAVTGCSTQQAQQPDDPPPPATYTGPDYLKGTVGSLAKIRNYQALPVAGYGLVVGLDGTGSREVPSYLRQRILDRMRKLGVGSARYEGQLSKMSPEALLARQDTAVVAVRGAIPPGAQKGTRFDVVVSALEGTQTTSLVGGRLFTTNLGVGGMRPGVNYVEPMATARGDVYVNPFRQAKARNNDDEFVYNALVVAGGKTLQSRDLQLVLNQPSWNRSRDIADRINERYPAPPDAPARTAEAQNDVLIRLNIPPTYANRTERFVRLIQHLFTQRTPNFASRKARQLAEALKADPERSESIALAWQALGRTIVPVLRQYYTAEALPLKLAALDAGAALKDERASRHLRTVSQHPDAEIRQRVARILLHLPESTRGSQTLKRMLNDTNRAVRIEAYESLQAMNDPLIGPAEGGAVRDRSGDIKFLIDLVPSDRPLIYITQEQTPRIAIFQPTLAFQPPLLASIWGNDLMLRADEGQKQLELFYNFKRPGKTSSETFDRSLNVAKLIQFLAHEPTMSRPQEGLGLSYSRTVDAVYQLCRQGAIDSPIEVRVSELAKQLDRNQRMNPRQYQRSEDRPATQPARVPAQPGGDSAAQPGAAAGSFKPADQPGG